MKKAISLVIVAVLMVSAVMVSVSAATLTDSAKEVIDYLKAVKLPAGIEVPAEYIAQAETYFTSAEVELSDEDVAAIKAEIDAAAKIVNDAGVTSLDKLSAAQKTSLIESVTDAADVLGLEVKVDAEKDEITFVDAEGKVVAKAEDIIKTTGGVESITVIFAVLAVIACGALVVSRKVRS